MYSLEDDIKMMEKMDREIKESIRQRLKNHPIPFTRLDRMEADIQQLQADIRELRDSFLVKNKV